MNENVSEYSLSDTEIEKFLFDDAEIDENENNSDRDCKSDDSVSSISDISIDKQQKNL